MTKYKFASLLGTVMALQGAVALAQTPAPASGAPQARAPSGKLDKDEQAATVGDVVVSARANDVRTSIDSISYSLADDLQAATGTLAEALRNVPSVDVDPQGNVSLRGDSNVTILVDGRPSAILSGPSRGDAILQMPGDRYARIEVMTNPSAAYSPEGTGGVINLISKPVPAAVGAAAAGGKGSSVTTGSMRANIGDHGRWNIGASGSRQQGKLTLTGDLSYRRDSPTFAFNSVREQFDASGATVSSTRASVANETTQSGVIGRASAEYRLTDKTMLSGEVRLTRFDVEGRSEGEYETRDASGALARAYNRDGDTAFKLNNWGVTGRVLHQFDASGHEWSNELRYDRNEPQQTALFTNTYLTPAAPVLLEAQAWFVEQETIGFTSAYTRPMLDGAKLRAGYELNLTRPNQDSELRRGPSKSALAPVPGLNTRVQGELAVHAVYATFERPFGDKLSGQLGLRLEQADVEVEDVTNDVRADQDYFRAYPTMHLQYQLTDAQSLRGSYSRRIQRPQPFQLNPAVIYGDPLNLRSGNPDLEPQETDSFEAMWQMRRGQNFYQATAYYRDTAKAFTDVASDIGGGVFLTRPENLGARRDLGVELTTSGRLHPTLRYNASVNAFRQEIDAAGIPGGRDREGEMLTGRVSLNWQATPKDFVQVMGFWQGDQLLAQGMRESGGMVNLGYRRKLNDTLSFQFTARDLFNSFGGATVYDTPQFRERVEQDFKLRAIYVGLTWSFGGGPRRQPEQFDFSTGPTGG